MEGNWDNEGSEAEPEGTGEGEAGEGRGERARRACGGATRGLLVSVFFCNFLGAGSVSLSIVIPLVRV